MLYSLYAMCALFSYCLLAQQLCFSFCCCILRFLLEFSTSLDVVCSWHWNALKYVLKNDYGDGCWRLKEFLSLSTATIYVCRVFFVVAIPHDYCYCYYYRCCGVGSGHIGVLSLHQQPWIQHKQ